MLLYVLQYFDNETYESTESIEGVFTDLALAVEKARNLRVTYSRDHRYKYYQFTLEVSAYPANSLVAGDGSNSPEPVRVFQIDRRGREALTYCRECLSSVVFCEHHTREAWEQAIKELEVLS